MDDIVVFAFLVLVLFFLVRNTMNETFKTLGKQRKLVKKVSKKL